MKKINIEFDFRDHRYNAIIRVSQKGGRREFHITVLNWELERLLYGNEVISEADGSIQANLLLENKEQAELKLVIAAGLSRHLKIPCFVGDQCVSSDPPKEGWEGLHPIPRHTPIHSHGLADGRP